MTIPRTPTTPDSRLFARDSRHSSNEPVAHATPDLSSKCATLPERGAQLRAALGKCATGAASRAAAEELGINLDAPNAKVRLRASLSKLRDTANERQQIRTRQFAIDPERPASSSDWKIETARAALEGKSICHEDLATILSDEHLRLTRRGRHEAADALAGKFQDYFEPNERDVQAATQLWTRHDAKDARYLEAAESGDMQTAQSMVDDAARQAGVPIKTLRAYKMFRTLKTRPGEIFPLFIGKTVATEKGTWVQAEYLPTKGYAARPGWHAGTLPTAPHLMKKDGSMPTDRVWAEVEVSADENYQAQADASKTRDIRDAVPEGGYYRFKTNKMQGGAWIIGGAIKISRLLSNEEAARITEKGEISEPARSSETQPISFDDNGEIIALSKRFATTS